MYHVYTCNVCSSKESSPAPLIIETDLSHQDVSNSSESFVYEDPLSLHSQVATYRNYAPFSSFVCRRDTHALQILFVKPIFKKNRNKITEAHERMPFRTFIERVINHMVILRDHQV